MFHGTRLCNQPHILGHWFHFHLKIGCFSSCYLTVVFWLLRGSKGFFFPSVICITFHPLLIAILCLEGRHGLQEAFVKKHHSTKHFPATLSMAIFFKLHPCHQMLIFSPYILALSAAFFSFHALSLPNLPATTMQHMSACTRWPIILPTLLWELQWSDHPIVSMGNICTIILNPDQQPNQPHITWSMHCLELCERDDVEWVTSKSQPTPVSGDLLMSNWWFNQEDTVCHHFHWQFLSF